VIALGWVAQALLVLALGFLLASIPLMTRARTQKRLARELSFDSDMLLTGAARVAHLASEIKQREADLVLYDGLSRLREGEAKVLTKRIEESPLGGVRATWIACAVSVVLGIIATLVIQSVTSSSTSLRRSGFPTSDHVYKVERCKRCGG
jgi:hypothetical protein